MGEAAGASAASPRHWPVHQTRVVDGLEAEDAAAFAENERLGLHR
jgi:hypothetical protein